MPKEKFKKAIEDSSVADVEPVKRGYKVVKERHKGIAYAIDCPVCGGRFPSNEPYTEKIEYCSECGKRLDDTFQNYCPACGAKMDRKE